MYFLHLKSCSQDLCLCCCFGRRNMRCLYMHTTFPWSCTAETILFVQPVTNMFWPRIQLPGQDCIVSAHMYVIEYSWVRAKVVRFSIAPLEFSLLYLPHTIDSFYALPHQKYRPSSFSTEQPLHQNFHFHRKTRYRTKTRKPRTDIGKHGYLVLENGGH